MKPKLPEPEIVTRNGKPVSVILPIKVYQEMVERIEDAEDVAHIKKARSNRFNIALWKTFSQALNYIISLFVYLG